MTLRHAGEVLPFRKDGHVTQQDIDSNKYLRRVLEHVRDAQLARDAAALHSSTKMTLRQKERLEADLRRRAAGDGQAEVEPDPDPDMLRRAVANVRLARNA